jgi:ankyrin repeat protein
LWHYESALALIEKGADVNVADREGYSALHLAMGHASEMNEKVINSLIARHASVNARTRRGETPFKLAADYGLRVNMDILAGANADPRLRKIPVEQPGQTPGPPRIPPEGK